MSRERYNQIIDEVYDFYCKSFDNQCRIEIYLSFGTDPMTKVMFVEKIKNLDWFSQEWGLKIEEKELSSEERKTLYREHCMKNFWALKLHGTTLHYEHCMKDFWDLKITGMNEVDYEKANIPTKVVTLIYQNETVITYE